MLSVSENEKAGLVLAGQDGEVRVGLGADPENSGQPGLLLEDQDARPRAWLGVKSDRESNLTLFDQSGMGRASIVAGNDAPGWDLNDRTGKPRAIFMVKSDGTPTLNLFDRSGVPRFSLYVDGSDGSGDLGFADSGKTLRAAIGVLRGRPYLELSDPGQKPLILQ